MSGEKHRPEVLKLAMIVSLQEKAKVEKQLFLLAALDIVSRVGGDQQQYSPGSTDLDEMDPKTDSDSRH